MVRTYGRLFAALALVVISVLSITRVAMAGGPPTPSDIALECNDAFFAVFNATGDRIDMQTDAAIQALDDAADDGATPAQLLKLASTSATKIEKDAFKAAAQMEKIISKCVAKLERMGADEGLIGEIEGLGKGILITQSNAAGAVYDLTAEVTEILDSL